jgi:hypothetical protein
MAYPTQKIVTVAALFLGLAFASGCQKNYDKSATCQTVKDCPRNGAVTDFQVPEVADCCSGYCVAAAAGCTSSLRFLVGNASGNVGVGDCVPDNMCKVDLATPTPPADLTTAPADLTPASGDM